jgi:murein DD-endopeptidase MepM/ murein hydrolase activator NlpD
MLTSSRLRQHVAPALLTGLLFTTTFASAPAAAAAGSSNTERAISQKAPSGRVSATSAPNRIAVVPGVRLTPKPPPWVLPVTGYDLTGRFGQSSGLWSSAHTGLDFAAPEGSKVRAVGPGVGQRLGPGDLVGYVGSTGNSTGPHLHLEVHPGRGKPVDPAAWLTRHDLVP